MKDKNDPGNTRKITHATRALTAIMLGVSEKCVTNWRDREGLPFFREGGKIFYNCRDVHFWYIDREIRRLGIIR